MPNLLEQNYAQTGQSTNTDALGMREMQARVYAVSTFFDIVIVADLWS